MLYPKNKDLFRGAGVLTLSIYQRLPYDFYVKIRSYLSYLLARAR